MRSNAAFSERFLKPIQAILDHDDGETAEGRGFAVLALDCLLLESLYGYQRGRHTNVGATGAAFEKILLREPFRADFEPGGRAASFGRAVRNGILHDGETRDGWIVWKAYGRGAPMVEERDGITRIYREIFHEGVKTYVTRYFESLREDSPDATTLRENFKCRVNELCEDSAPPPIVGPPLVPSRPSGAERKTVRSIQTLVASGFPDIDDALAALPDALATIAPYEQHVGYKAWKAPGKRRANWMQWNDGDVPLRINFPNQAGEMRTWKVFARFASGARIRGPWERPGEYERSRAQWMLSGSDVWGVTYESLGAYLARLPELEELLREDVAEAFRYAAGRLAR
jgi:hypothetical protein